MITVDTWPESWGTVPAWTEVSEEVYNYFLNVLSPLRWRGGYFQNSEPYSHGQNGKFWCGKYLTFTKADGKYWFLGIQFPGCFPERVI